jgi:hypothetical protein
MENFTFNSSIHSINTSHRLKLHKPLVRLKLYQQSLYYNCINIYNKLPDELAKLISDKKQLLQQLKKYLIDKLFYTMNQFFEYQRVYKLGDDVYMYIHNTHGLTL